MRNLHVSHTIVNEEEGDGETTRSETSSLLSYTLRYVSFTEVGRVYRVSLREPMNLCTSVNEEGVDEEAARSETASLLCTSVSEEEGDGGAVSSETPSLC